MLTFLASLPCGANGHKGPGSFVLKTIDGRMQPGGVVFQWSGATSVATSKRSRSCWAVSHLMMMTSVLAVAAIGFGLDRSDVAIEARCLEHVVDCDLDGRA